MESKEEDAKKPVLKLANFADISEKESENHQENHAVSVFFGPGKFSLMDNRVYANRF